MMQGQDTVVMFLCVSFLALLSLAVAANLETPARRSHQSSRRLCKPIPGSSDWPTTADWQALNASISGRLFAPAPPGAVCHHDWPVYDSASCTVVSSQWSNTSLHASDPVSVDYNDETCLPRSDAPCSAVGYPEYVVEAHGKEDVQAAVDFARKTGVRLVVKNTGHSFPGRSSGAYSLSIYTHGLTGLQLNQNDATATAFGGIASVKIFAGEQMRSIYRFAADNNVTIVGGSDPNVGTGGWVSAGGHSPLSAKYGMGADQVLSMEVVTADGKFRNIDADRNPDLFWAMRGGGPGTFAVLISVTVKVYPPISITSYAFSYTTRNDSEAFWSLAAYLHTELPRLSESGLMGYFWVAPDTSASDRSNAGRVYGILLGPELSVDQVKAVMASTESSISASQWGDPVMVQTSADLNPNFASLWAQNPAESAGGSARLGSRLWGNDTLNGDLNKLKKALRTSTPVPNSLIGHLVAGPGTHKPPGGIPGGRNSVLPAWRKIYAHIVISRALPAFNETAKTQTTTDLRDVYNKALADVAPYSGAYLNEADPTDPEWKVNFFGTHYPKLFALKQRWDPDGVFWCKSCVGSDLWVPVGPFGVENGVGQSVVQLCRNNFTRLDEWLELTVDGL